jgi:hypothetical protein
MPLPHRRAAYNLPAAGHLCKRATDIFSKDSQPKWMFEHATHSLILPGDSRGDSWPSAFVWEFWEISIRTFVRITQPTMRFSIRRHSWEFQVETRWLPTPTLLEPSGERAMEACDGLWASPGSPYASFDGMLRGIEFARSRNWPFVGT